jgi:hypothetical protein
MKDLFGCVHLLSSSLLQLVFGHVLFLLDSQQSVTNVCFTPLTLQVLIVQNKT